MAESSSCFWKPEVFQHPRVLHTLKVTMHWSSMPWSSCQHTHTHISHHYLQLCEFTTSIPIELPLALNVKFWRSLLYPLLELNVIVFCEMLIWLEKLSISVLFC
jgi:hypothetical protein